MEKLSQSEFAFSLGVKRGYISTLETHRNEPSEQLILNICRAFGVLYDWLKYGNGRMYEAPRLTPRGRSIMREIVNEILSSERRLPIRQLALLLGIDPDVPSNRFNFPEGFDAALALLIEIFREGEPAKVDAILAQLKVLRPKVSMRKVEVA